MGSSILPSSFRDPSGFLFEKDGKLFRQVNRVYQKHYEKFIKGGLYETLVQDHLLVPHRELPHESGLFPETFKVIQPEKISFISYPYEWCFSQLKDAALTLLRIQQEALNKGMVLKDASAYNIQFHHGKPILIDTLSFECYEKGTAWQGYRQFCQHFFAPLVLMSCKDVRLNQLMRNFIDGIPLGLASSLLSLNSYLNISILVHIHIHSRFQTRHGNRLGSKAKTDKLNAQHLMNLKGSLESAIRKLKWDPPKTEWRDYYKDSNHLEKSSNVKKQHVEGFLNRIDPKSVWDLGANTGLYSRITASRGISTVSFDMDPACVENNYRYAVEKNETHILPLLMDLTNPSPKIGWQNLERLSLADRGPVDTALALALIHHLAISNNVPLSRIADFFSKICRALIIEFVPKTDPMVQKLLETRTDIFGHYTQEDFEKNFSRFFSIQAKDSIDGSPRILYLMKRK